MTLANTVDLEMTAKSAILKKGDISKNLILGLKQTDKSEDSYYDDNKEDQESEFEESDYNSNENDEYKDGSHWINVEVAANIYLCNFIF